MFIAGLNFLICSGIVLICICRLDKIDRTIRLSVGLQYVVLCVMAGAYALSPLLGSYPSWIDTAFSTTMLYILISDGYQWRHGKAPEAATKPGDLHEVR